MRVKLPVVLMAVAALLGTGIPAFAHHGFSAEFDKSKCMDLKGTLTGIDWETRMRTFIWMWRTLTARRIRGAWK